ncbi:MAG: metal-sulfur cluster assembly factor [Bacteroidia bacterium]|jgi:metal-sulfur cluster biosynthetic enzyme|nr:metal-sulfur cluster assembly factor [Bacteroidia bacterium]MCC6767899.1 metal-sulfur cluster assembly factor [Bacteroidia bacterium]
MSVETNNNIKGAIAEAVLEHVYDPEIGLNVVSLGLIYSLIFDDEALKVNCTMTLTTEFCPMGESITGNVKTSLEGAFPDHQVEVILTFEPAWSFELIDEEGRKFLGR